MIKRKIDIIISLAVIIFCFPFVGLILFFIFLLTGNNPLFLQARKISLDRKGFNIIKIRTIKNSKQFLELEKGYNKIFFKKEYEAYVPSFCKWLRKTGLDEILQVINVLKGEMSFVGPRPLLVSDLVIMQKTEPELYSRRSKIKSKPGITGYWQVFGERTKGISNLIELDEKYEKEKSILFDLKIISKTLFVFLTASHSDSIITEKNQNGKSILSAYNRSPMKFHYQKFSNLLILPYKKTFSETNID